MLCNPIAVTLSLVFFYLTIRTLARDIIYPLWDIIIIFVGHNLSFSGLSTPSSLDPYSDYVGSRFRRTTSLYFFTIYAPIRSFLADSKTSFFLSLFHFSGTSTVINLCGTQGWYFGPMLGESIQLDHLL